MRSIFSRYDFSSRAEHAYPKERLEAMVLTVQEVLQSRDYVFASFLDIEGEFINEEISTFINDLEETGTDRMIIAWMGNIICCRTINSRQEDGEVRKVVTRGTAQRKEIT